MFDSEHRNRTLAATPGRDAKPHDRRRAKSEKTRAQTSTPAHRWVEDRRANRTAKPTTRLPAFVAS